MKLPRNLLQRWTKRQTGAFDGLARSLEGSGGVCCVVRTPIPVHASVPRVGASVDVVSLVLQRPADRRQSAPLTINNTHCGKRSEMSYWYLFYFFVNLCEPRLSDTGGESRVPIGRT